jgi:hypothetical protein
VIKLWQAPQPLVRTSKIKSDRRFVLVCDWQTTYSNRAHEWMRSDGPRASSAGRSGASLQYAAGVRGGEVAVDEVLSFYTCRAISILFQHRISDSLLGSFSSPPPPNFISLTNQSKNNSQRSAR